MEIERGEYINTLGMFKPVEYSLGDCRLTIKIIEANISRFLDKLSKQWEEDPTITQWRE
jgi:hypothetical protein